MRCRDARKQETPLHSAARACSLNNIDFLLASPDVDIDATSADGSTPLVLAILSYEYFTRVSRRREKKPTRRAFLSTIVKLLAANADFSLESRCGIFRVKRGEIRQAAIEISVKAGLHDVVQVLAVLGAKMPYGLDVEMTKYLRQNFDLLKWVTNFHLQPMTLKNLCRIEIRRHLGRKMRFCAHQLPLPKPMFEFLQLSDFNEMCQEEEEDISKEGEKWEHVHPMYKEEVYFDSDD